MRKIIHIDMDCFFASVEIRDDARLQGLPVAVGGSPDSRGVISAASYEARAFGVHSALATAVALRRCPKLVLIKPNFEKYKTASRLIYDIFSNYSDIIEPISIDEAFIDVTRGKLKFDTATQTAKAIREHIFRETGLKASAGIAPNPFLAKVASAWNKPNGQFTVTPAMIDSFVAQLPLRKVPGVGKVTEQKLKDLGFLTCGELQRLEMNELLGHFGKWGTRLFSLCRGIDERPLGLKHERKSLSVEHTFPHDLATITDCLEALPALLEEVKRRLIKISSDQIKSLFVKLKFADFRTTTADDISLTSVELPGFEKLLARAHGRSEKSVRLVGIGVRLKDSKPESLQLELFPNIAHFRTTGFKDSF